VLSGFTIVRNAITFDYPIVATVRSLLDVCDEVIVNVGRSSDGTRDAVAGVGDPRVRILDTVWDTSRAGATLARETDRAMAACRGSWGLYIQADEVLHESGAALLVDALCRADPDPAVEGLLVDYLHFYGDVDTVVTNRGWYRREVRAVRLGCDIRSYGDAQGFRVGPDGRRVRARLTGACMYHYGWARPAAALARKQAGFAEYFTEQPGPAGETPRAALEWTPGLRRFTGEHPRAAAAWVAARHGSGSRIGPYRFRLRDLRFYLSDAIERATGRRLFEYRNYVVV